MADFFFTAKEKDPITGMPKNPELYDLAKRLEKSKPEYGIGSKLGGYICICEFCGDIVHTYNGNKKFCSQDCRAAYWTTRSRKSSFVRGKPYGKVLKRCECCGEEFKIAHGILASGRGIFCGPECHKKLKVLKSQWFICNNCGSHFKAISSKNANFCCIECERVAPRAQSTDINPYTQYTPRFLDEEPRMEKLLELNDQILVAYKLYLHDTVPKNTPAKDFPPLPKEIITRFVIWGK